VLGHQRRPEQLPDLTDRGLIAKSKNAANGKSEVYRLTPKGRSLSGPLKKLYEWGCKNAGLYGLTVGMPLMKLDRTAE
jgi:DNA-binding HxlR family transcriptional regulator